MATIFVERADVHGLLPRWELDLRSRALSPSTLTAYGSALRLFVRFSLDSGFTTDVESITRYQLGAFVADQLARHAPATARLRFQALRTFFRWLEDEGAVVSSPAARMRPPRVPAVVIQIVPDDSLTLLLRAAHQPRDEAVLRVLIDSGLRSAELRGLRVEDADLGAGLLRVEGKGAKLRYVPLAPSTVAALRRWHDVRPPGEPLFHLTKSGLRRLIDACAEQAGLGHIHAHQFRHTFAHRWLDAGGSETDLMTLAGWTSRQMLDRYGAAARVQRALAAHRRLALGDGL